MTELKKFMADNQMSAKDIISQLAELGILEVEFQYETVLGAFDQDPSYQDAWRELRSLRVCGVELKKFHCKDQWEEWTKTLP